MDFSLNFVGLFGLFCESVSLKKYLFLKDTPLKNLIVTNTLPAFDKCRSDAEKISEI